MLTWEWPSLTNRDWQELLSKTSQANWMQSWPYARALYRLDYKKPRLGLIKKNHDTIGFCVIYEIKLGPIHFIDILRGPLWLDRVTEHEQRAPKSNESSSKEMLLLEFAELLERTWPGRIMRRRRWLVEAPYSEALQSEIGRRGFRLRNETFETYRVSLAGSLSDIRSRLHQKWRGALNKVERDGALDVRIDKEGRALNLFLESYQSHLLDKKYRGPSPQFIKEEFSAGILLGSGVLLWAFLGSTPVAGIYLSQQGENLCYRIGWNSESGRSHSAHNLLLWKAIEWGHQQGLKVFDLGGVLPQEEPGLTHFKAGLGGEFYKSVGIYS